MTFYMQFSLCTVLIVFILTCGIVNILVRQVVAKILRPHLINWMFIANLMYVKFSIKTKTRRKTNRFITGCYFKTIIAFFKSIYVFNGSYQKATYVYYGLF